jgi:putative heme iron utilization protein
VSVLVSEDRDRSLVIEMNSMADLPLAIAVAVGRSVQEIWDELGSWNDEATVIGDIGQVTIRSDFTLSGEPALIRLRGA